MKKTIKLRQLIENLEELSRLGGDNDEMEVHVNVGGYDETVSVRHVCIASNDEYDYISIDTELSK